MNKALSFMCIFVALIFFPIITLASVDLDVFKNVDGITFDYDGLDDSFSVSTDVTTLVSRLFLNHAAINASIVGGLNKPYLMSLNFFVSGYDGNFHPSSAVIKTDNNRYFFDISYGYSDNSTDLHVEFAVISCGIISLNMIQDMIRSKDVQIRINGTYESVDFTLDKDQMNNLEQVLTLYNKAGGISSNTVNKADVDDSYNFSIMPILPVQQ